MLHPIQVNDLAKVRQQEMIAEAAAYRRTHQASPYGLKQVGRLLISLAQKLKGGPIVKARLALTTK